MSIIAQDLDAHGNRHWGVTTAPAVEPVTLSEAKTGARIDGDDEDDLIEGYIKSARSNLEKYLGRAFISQTITLQMDFWPGEVVKLPRPPLISITSVSTLDEDDTATTYDSDNYYTMTVAEPGQLVLKQGVTYPYNTDRSYGGYRIIYLAGYGLGPTEVPQPIRDGIIMWVTEIYDTRVLTAEPPQAVKNATDFYKMPRMCY